MENCLDRELNSLDWMKVFKVIFEVCGRKSAGLARFGLFLKGFKPGR
jgi:hypothetical protein